MNGGDKLIVWCWQGADYNIVVVNMVLVYCRGMVLVYDDNVVFGVVSKEWRGSVLLVVLW